MSGLRRSDSRRGTSQGAHRVVQKKYHDARHVCYAYRLGPNLWRTKDDGEPHGTAGAPILRSIDARGLDNILVVVVRYFGGTLLGTGGLMVAYREAAKAALDNW